jgi:Tfp pilus assembly protein PilF
LQRGLAYFNLGRYDLAIADFNNTIALDPVEADAYRGRSEAYRQLGKSDLAAADMMRFAKLNR